MEIVLLLFEYLILVLSISIHDCAQTWAAFRLGDPTARMLGRFTLNPLRHYDMWGTVIWPVLFLFVYRSPFVVGWGKDVPITARNLRRRELEIVIYLAGPLAQFLTAVVCLVLLVVWKHLSATAAACIQFVPVFHTLMAAPQALPGIFPLVLLLYLGILVSLFLMVFNLLPLPALDGGKILRYYLPYRTAQIFDQYGLYITIGFLLLGGYLLNLVTSPFIGLFQHLLETM